MSMKTASNRKPPGQGSSAAVYEQPPRPTGKMVPSAGSPGKAKMANETPLGKNAGQGGSGVKCH